LQWTGKWRSDSSQNGLVSRKSCWHLILFPACIRRGAERPPSNTMLSAESQNPPASSCLVYLWCQMLSGTVLQVKCPSLVFPSLKGNKYGHKKTILVGNSTNYIAFY